MNLDRMIEDWKALKRRIRKQWSRLTERDLEELEADGGLDGLERTLQRRYGISRKQAQQDLSDFAADLGTTFREAAASFGDAAVGAWRHGRDRVKDTFVSGKDRAREFLASGKDKARDALEGGKDRAREMFAEGKDRARELYESGRERVDEYVKKTEKAVRSRPMASIAVAAGIGALLVILFRRR